MMNEQETLKRGKRGLGSGMYAKEAKNPPENIRINVAFEDQENCCNLGVGWTFTNSQGGLFWLSLNCGYRAILQV